jgi:hypothetical protein
LQPLRKPYDTTGQHKSFCNQSFPIAKQIKSDTRHASLNPLQLENPGWQQQQLKAQDLPEQKSYQPLKWRPGIQSDASSLFIPESSSTRSQRNSWNNRAMIQ